MGVVNKAPEYWSDEQKKAYRQSAWKTTLEGFVRGSTEGFVAGSAAGPWGMLIGAAAGGIEGVVSGGMEGKAEREGMVAKSEADTQQALLSEQASRSAEVARDTQQKAAGKGMSDSQYDSLKGDLDALAGGMPSSGNPYPTKDYGNRFKDYGW